MKFETRLQKAKKGTRQITIHNNQRKKNELVNLFHMVPNYSNLERKLVKFVHFVPFFNEKWNKPFISKFDKFGSEVK